MSVLEFRNVVKTFGAFTAVDGLSFVPAFSAFVASSLAAATSSPSSSSSRSISLRLRSWEAPNLSLELGDEQLEMRHHRFGAGRARLGLRPGQALGRQRRPQGHGHA